MKAFKRAFGISALLALLQTLSIAQPFPGTQPLTMDGDLAAQMVNGIDKYLDRVLADAPKNRARVLAAKYFIAGCVPEILPSDC